LYGSPANSARADSASLGLLRDVPHPLLDGLQVLGREGNGDIEVVVEAVFDRRPDPELGVGKQLLYRLGQHVGSGMAQDIKAVGAVDGDCLDDVAGGQRRGQVPQLSADAHRDHFGAVGEKGGGGGPRVDLARRLGAVRVVDFDGDVRRKRHRAWSAYGRPPLVLSGFRPAVRRRRAPPPTGRRRPGKGPPVVNCRPR
jgi:hypothetical protein